MPITETDLELLTRPERKLDANDRCDRCNAQAYVGWAEPGKDEPSLLLCSHHNTDHEPALIEKGWSAVIDERHLLLIERESSA